MKNKLSEKKNREKDTPDGTNTVSQFKEKREENYSDPLINLSIYQHDEYQVE